MKRTLVLLFVAGFCITGVGLMVSKRRAEERAAQQQAAWQKAKADREAELAMAGKQANAPAAPVITPPVLNWPVAEEKAAAPANPPPSEPVKDAAPRKVKPPAAPSSQPPPPKQSKWQDPVAREALSYVGLDPDAEEVWAEAINNPDLPLKERKDLIEDLNEEGFADPKNLTLDDLPLIVRRLQILEDQWFLPHDEVNDPPLKEAYKDLYNMYLRLMGQ